MFFGLTSSWLSSHFEFARHNTNLKTEVLAGLSTFLALSYIFVVNPSILSEAGLSKSAVLFATVVTSFLATFLMGLWAKKPFALAPGMEINSYVAFFVVAGLGFTWQQALGAVFWSGVLFMVLTLTGIRTRIIQAIPDKMKSALALCVGVFLMLIALRLSGILVYSGITISSLGFLLSPMAFVLYFGLALVLILRWKKVSGSVLISIILATVLAHFFGLGTTSQAISTSQDFFSGILQLDLGVILNPKALSVILVLFLVDFYGTVAKFIGLTRNTSIVNKDGTMPEMKEALSIDGAATMLGSTLGTTSIVAYVESGVGIAEGGRTGVTAMVCALLMLAVIPLAPLLELIPLIATTGALFWVGTALLPSKQELSKYTLAEIATVLVMILGVIWTFSIDKALLFGFLTFIAGEALSGKIKKINPYLIASTILLLVGTLLTL